MRRVNVDRMRRHMARTTPDRRRWRFTDAELAAAESSDSLVRQHLDHWGALMRHKHGEQMPAPEVTIWRDGDPLFGTSVVEAKARP